MTETDKPTLYLESTIPSYLAAHPSRDLIVAAHQQITHDWWQRARGAFDLHVSAAVLEEIDAGDPDAASRRQAFVADLPVLRLTDEVAELAAVYRDQLGLPRGAQLDAIHLAYAVAYEMSYLLTWNCKHLANGVVIHRLHDLNAELGRFVPVIVTPEELFEAPGGE